MQRPAELRLLGAVLTLVGLVLGAVVPGNYISAVGLTLGLSALVLLLRGRPARLLPWAAVALLAVALQAVGPLPGLLLSAGAALLLWVHRARFLPPRLPRSARLLLFGLGFALLGLFLPWTAAAGRFAGGYSQQSAPLSGQPLTIYDPLASWVPEERQPGRQLLASLLPLLAWGALLFLAITGRPAQLRRLGPPLWLLLIAWWLLQRSILPGGLLYLGGTGLVGLALLRVDASRQANDHEI